MSGLRLVLVTRRFWPLLGGAERMMANLAEELCGRGVAVTLLTARWERHWPAEFAYRGVPVIRLPQPRQRLWGTWRYMRALRSWLGQHRGEYDLVYVSMLKHDAYATIGAIGREAPVVLRAEGGGPTGDCAWQRQSAYGWPIRRRCARAAAFVAPSRAIEEELLAAGYPQERVHAIPNGVAIPAPADAERKAAARAALAGANVAMQVPEGTQVAVYTGRLHEAKGLIDLIDAWTTVVARRPHARLWIVGEGPMERDLARLITARRLLSQVTLAGVFDSVDEVLAAADVFVLPSWEEGMSLALLEAMAAGLPVVATDIPGNRQLVSDGQEALLVPPRAPVALAAAIERVLADAPRAERLGEAARARVEGSYSLRAMADAHLALFERLAQHNRQAN